MQRAILDENNDFGPEGPRLGEGIASAATALQAGFGTQQGDWAYDKPFGCPWRNGVFGKYFDAGATLSIIASVAEDVRERSSPYPDFEPVTAAQISLDTTTQAAERQVDITIANVTATDDTQDVVITTTA